VEEQRNRLRREKAANRPDFMSLLLSALRESVTNGVLTTEERKEIRALADLLGPEEASSNAG
jgi:hypothetical protein